MNDTITVRIRHDSSEEIFNNLKQAYKESKKDDKKVIINVWKSKWNQMGARKYIIKAAQEFAGMKLEKSGREEPLLKLKNNLKDLGYSDRKIKRYIDDIYLIYSLENIGMFYVPSNKPLRILGYPKDLLVPEFLTEKEISLLKQMELINEIINVGELKTPSIRLNDANGIKVVENYIEKIIDEKGDKIEELINRYPSRLLYCFFHPETMKFPHKDVLSVRPFEKWRFEKNSLFYEIQKLDIEDVDSSEKIDGKHNEILDEITEFWDNLISHGLAIEAPTLKVTKSDEYSGVTTTAYERIGEKKESQGSLPLGIAEYIFEIFKNKLECEKLDGVSEQTVINILMSLNHYKDKPKKMKGDINSGRTKYDLNIDDIEEVKFVVNKLSEKGITSKWSDSGDIPFTIKNTEELLYFTKLYMLEKENLE